MIWIVFPKDNEPAIHPVLEFSTFEEARDYAAEIGVDCDIEENPDGDLV